MPLDGAIIQGQNQEQNAAGAGVGAFVPNKEDPQTAQDAIMKVQDRNMQWQLMQDKKNEAQRARAAKALSDAQISFDGIRAVDRQPLLDEQKVVNDYATHAFAAGKDPTDPRNVEEFTKFNALQNAALTHANASKLYNSQITDAAKQYQAHPELYDEGSLDLINKHTTVPMSQALQGGTGDYEGIGIGKPILKKKGYDLQTDLKATLPNFASQAWETKDNNGTVNQYEGKDYPRQKDKTGAEIVGTSGIERLADQKLSEPKFREYTNNWLRDHPNQHESLQKQADALTAAGTPTTVQQLASQMILKPAIGSALKKSEEDPESKMNRAIRQANAINDHKAYLKGSEEQDAQVDGYDLYDKFAKVASGSPSAYVKRNGGLYSTELGGYTIGTYVGKEDNEDKGKSVPNHIIETQYTGEDENGNPIVWAKTDASIQAKKLGESESEWIREPDLVGKYAPQAINQMYKGKQYVAAMEGLQANAKYNKEFRPGAAYDMKNYRKRTAPVSGTEYQNESGLTDAEEYEQKTSPLQKILNIASKLSGGTSTTKPQSGAIRATRAKWLASGWTDKDIEEGKKSGKIIVDGE